MDKFETFRPILIFIILLVGCNSPTAISVSTGTPTNQPPELPAVEVTWTPLPTYTSTPLLPTASSTSLPPTATRTPEPTATLLPTLSGSGGGVIAFAREASNRRDIYLINVDGSSLTALTNDAGWDNWPSWSPDGSQLAFTCRQSIAGLGGGICVINRDGSGRRALTGSGEWEPSWSPDGRYIVFASERDGNPEIYVMNADGSRETRLTHDSADDWQASWSPDSMRIAFVSERDGDWEIYIMDVSDGGVIGDRQLIQLTDNDTADGFPDWSPDGKQIVFSSRRDGNEEIYLMNADGSDQQRLTDNQMNESFPRWSPDGLRIAYTTFSPVANIYSYDIAIMNADGSGQRQVTRTNQADEQCPNWRP